MFYDRSTIYIKAGNGGNGIVTFRHSKEAARGGPDGGDGGKGGSIYFEASDRENTLLDFVRQKEFKATDGEMGGSARCHGKNGEEMVLSVPVGTIIYKISPDGKKQLLADLVKKGERVLAARGGRGGFGNAHFTSSTRQTPKFAEFGSPGDEADLALELRLVADVALVGFPSAGKSTLISRVTSARPKIADYPFTTLTPNLGVIVRGRSRLVIADIPGLIEGASEGKGLGHEFLRHIQRTRMVVHLIDATSDDWVANYKTIRKELEKFDKKLSKEKEIVAINKIDLVDMADCKLRIADLKKKAKLKKIYLISALTGKNLDNLFDDVFHDIQYIKAPEIEIDHKKVFTFDDVDPRVFEIKKVTTGFHVYCKKLDEMALRTNFSNWQATARFTDIMKKLGVVKAMEKQGLKDGDLIWVGEKAVEWEG